MKEFDVWFEALATQALPGGVAAAAIAAAMGAALVIKVADTTLRHRSLSLPEQQQLEALLDLARQSSPHLLHLAGEDERAYRRVLQTRESAEDVDQRRQAWRQATEVPLRIAEASQALLLRLDPLADTCWPPVLTDLRAGRRLLAVGLGAGVEAAEENLRIWGEGVAALPLRARLEHLRREDL
ncbi:MAG: cyclodeaminase/cyclohydrolase family protein [Anaerolineae bacterium]